MKDWTEAGEEKNCRPLTLGSRVGIPASRGPGSEKGDKKSLSSWKEIASKSFVNLNRHKLLGPQWVASSARKRFTFFVCLECRGHEFTNRATFKHVHAQFGGAFFLPGRKFAG